VVLRQQLPIRHFAAELGSAAVARGGAYTRDPTCWPSAATFFVLGWVAERHPALIRDIAEQGHEIASHGYGHQLVYDLTAEAFQSDLARSLDIIQSAAGRVCTGYRVCPSHCVPAPWMWDTGAGGHPVRLVDLSVAHDRWRAPGSAVPLPGRRRLGPNCRAPTSTMRVAGKNIPVAGGAICGCTLGGDARAIGRINRQGSRQWSTHLWSWFRPAAACGVAVAAVAAPRGMASVAAKLRGLLGQFRSDLLRGAGCRCKLR
jgi:peptidoglycan/xylan/chitin deacetylase (PgdA/CDA1 family)